MSDTITEMTGNYSQITELCKALALRGGSMAYKAFSNGSIDSTQKSDKTYITKWDKQIEEVIREEILQNFPTHSVTGEELPDETKASAFRWYVDPIDGTSNFAAQVPLFCTMVGVTEGTELVASAVHIPATQNLFWAGKDISTCINDKVHSTFEDHPLSNHTLVIEKGHKDTAQEVYKKYVTKNLNTFRSIRSFGTVCGGLAMMMSGKPTTHIILGAELHDLASVAFLYKMAGLAVVNTEGKPWSIAYADLIATPQFNLKEVLETIS